LRNNAIHINIKTGGGMKKAVSLFVIFLLLVSALLAGQEVVPDELNQSEDSLPDGLEYEIVDGNSVTITEYTGEAETLNIPELIQGLPVTIIGDYAFFNCGNLTSITIPSSVTVIGGDAAFFGCFNLTSINVDSRNNTYASVDGVLFDKDIKTLIKYPAGKDNETYTIPLSYPSI
jgi:hypothetical protein